jgi:small subunit ribosomal protein S24e
MDVEIIDEDENPMLHRTDVRFQLTHEEATPSRLSVRDSLAAKLNKDASEVVVHKLDTKYGMRKTLGYVIRETEQRRSELYRQTSVLHDQVEPLRGEAGRLNGIVDRLKAIDAELAGESEEWLG